MLVEGKYPRLIILLLILLLVFIGFKYWNAHNEPRQQDPDNAKATSVTVVDSLGRKVPVPSKVERIACLDAFAVYATAMLGQGDKIIGVPNVMKRDILIKEIYPNVCSSLTAVTEGIININELQNANPDVVFLNSKTLKKEETDELEQAGIPYISVDYANMQEQQKAIMVIAKVLKEEVRAKEYNLYYQQCISRVNKKIADIPEEERIRVYHALNEATSTDSAGSLGADWINAAGAVSVSVNQSLREFEGESFASIEQVLQWNPDIILVNEPDTVDYIMDKVQLSSLRAVQQRRLYQMPIGISRWGHPAGIETPLAVMWTAKQLYVKQFANINIEDEAREFYQRFFDYQVSDEMLANILSGKGMLEESEPAG